MEYTGYTTFRAERNGAILTVTFDYPPVNIQGLPMIADRQAEQPRPFRSVTRLVRDGPSRTIAPHTIP